MEMYVDMVIKGIVYVVVAVFAWKVWPVIKEYAIVQKAIAIVHQMEEQFGGGAGELKRDTAVDLLQAFINKLGWKVDLPRIYGYVMSAVGVLHAEQGVLPEEKEVQEQGM